MKRLLPVAAALAISVVAGCGSGRPAQTMSSDLFYPGQSVRENPVADDVRQAPKEPQGAGSATTPGAVAEAPMQQTPARSTTRPATTQAIGDSTGKYQTLGGVLAVVNGTPIYLDKVMAEIDKALRDAASGAGPEEFRTKATHLIDEHVTTAIQSELVYAAAQQHLSQEEKGMADYATERWRQQKIAEAGGSVELARRKARAEGRDFDQDVQDQARQFMFAFYREKKFLPRAQVTAEDMRRYYAQNRATLFTKAEEVRFRVFRIDPKNHAERGDGRAEAIAKINEYRERAEAGEPFEDLVRDFSEDSEWMKKQGGDIGSIKRGSYRLTAVEDAVWPLQPGQITSIIEAENAYYIAKVEERKAGAALPFEAESVQRQIRETLMSQQVRELQDQEFRRLERSAIARRNADQFEAALEVAMQKYAQWKREEGKVKREDVNREGVKRQDAKREDAKRDGGAGD